MSFFTNRNGMGNDSHCKCLAQSINKTNGSTTFTDTARGGSHTLTAVASAAHSTTRAKFGTSSMAMLTGDYLTVTVDDDFDFDTKLTVDFFINNVAQPGRVGYFGVTNATGANRGLVFSNTSTNLRILIEDNGTNVFADGIIAMSNDVWYHMAAELNPDTDEGSLYFNGVYLGSGTINVIENDYSSGYIGAYIESDGSPQSNSNYYMENFRFSRGILRYNKRSFTPPNRPY